MSKSVFFVGEKWYFSCVGRVLNVVLMVFLQIQGLNNFLLEYSTRISSLEEHQQVRLFIEKLKQHRPLTASGVFTIDLGIAGPVLTFKTIFFFLKYRSRYLRTSSPMCWRPYSSRYRKKINFSTATNDGFLACTFSSFFPCNYCTSRRMSLNFLQCK